MSNTQRLRLSNVFSAASSICENQMHKSDTHRHSADWSVLFCFFAAGTSYICEKNCRLDTHQRRLIVARASKISLCSMYNNTRGYAKTKKCRSNTHRTHTHTGLSRSLPCVKNSYSFYTKSKIRRKPKAQTRY